MLLAITSGIFALVLVAGIVRSHSAEKRLPAIDLLASGSTRYIRDLVSREDYEGAIEQLNLQTRFLPSDAATYEYLGSVLGSQKRPQEARVHFQTLVQLRPDYAEGYNYLGSTYFDTGDLAMASQCFLRAIELKPEFPLALNNLGMTMAEAGKLELAAACFEKAVALAPDYGEAKVNLEWVQGQLKSKGQSRSP
jgi:Flp pilus assembly protein TadD